MSIDETAESPPLNAPKPSVKATADLSQLIIPKKIVRSKLSQVASQLPGMMQTANADFKKIKENMNKKKEIGIFPHDSHWKGATIEEIIWSNTDIESNKRWIFIIALFECYALLRCWLVIRKLCIYYVCYCCNEAKVQKPTTTRVSVRCACMWSTNFRHLN